MHRLRIVQQIIIVILFAVLVPFVTIGLIISNVSQQSVRRELNYGVTAIARYIANDISDYVLNADKELDLISLSLNLIPNQKLKNNYLTSIVKKLDKFESIRLISKEEQKDPEFALNKDKKTIRLYSDVDNKKELCAELKLNELDESLKVDTQKMLQPVFVFDDELTLISSNIDDKEIINEITKTIPKYRIENNGVLFSRIKNQPIAYYKLSNPSWTVVVMTHPSVTRNSIDKARERIILSLLIAAFCVFITVGLYTYYLYINIRQLFKAITAISRGNYDRKIRLLKSIFTPHEVVFLEKEFNYMTQKVSQAYTEISEKNLELKRLNEYRDSLVSAISHEFRTPLTSIIGYSSRLMRQDIKIDDEMKVKSLHIIKQQAQRLSRMVDDLLTVPDIESFHLSLRKELTDLSKAVELCVEYSSLRNVQFNLDFDKNLKQVYADYDRLIQVIVNLSDNAVKYNIDDEPIDISIKNKENSVELKISNKSETIPPEMLDKLYDKFIRMDSELTRTTRGTGLGLYIVKGLCEAMNIDVKLDNSNGRFTVILDFKSIEGNEIA